MKTAAEPVRPNDDLLLPPFATEQRESLRNSIRAEGIHTPVVQERVIACDIDPGAAETTRRRLARAGEQAPRR
jgi:hypothetical protein